MKIIGVDQSLSNTAIFSLNLLYEPEQYASAYQNFLETLSHLILALNVRPNEYNLLVKSQEKKGMSFLKFLMDSKYTDKDKLVIKSLFIKLCVIQTKIETIFTKYHQLFKDFNEVKQIKIDDILNYEYHLLTSNAKGVIRLIDYQKNYIKILEKEKDIVLLGLEGYSYNSSITRSLFELGELTSVFKIANHNLNIPTMIIPPALLKKVIALKGNANKDVMKEMILKRINLNFKNKKDDDLFDAFAIALFNLFLPFWDIDTILLKIKI